MKKAGNRRYKRHCQAWSFSDIHDRVMQKERTERATARIVTRPMGYMEID